jgi:uncharacterized glyoxalase superfamily protein PhnB
MPMQNRSVPTNILLPHIVYQRVPEAIDWLIRTFGFEEHYRYGDPAKPDGAQLHLGDAWVMLTSTRPGRSSPAALGAYTQMLTIFVPDVEAHLAHTREAGATIVEDLNETFYGELQYAAEDLEGHRWLFSRHARDISPADWGAIVAGR